MVVNLLEIDFGLLNKYIILWYSNPIYVYRLSIYMYEINN